MGNRRKGSYMRELIQQHIAGTLPTLNLGKHEEIVDGLKTVERLSDSFQLCLGNIDVDPKLTVAGQDAARQKVAEETLMEFGKWHAPLIDGLERHADALRQELANAIGTARQAPTDVAGRIEAALLRSEIRGQIRGREPSEIEVLYRTAPAVVRMALEEIPNIRMGDGVTISTPFISEELRQEVLLNEGRELLPEKAALLDSLAELKDLYEGVAVALKREVEDAAPAAFDRPLKIVS